MHGCGPLLTLQLLNAFITGSDTLQAVQAHPGIHSGCEHNANSCTATVKFILLVLGQLGLLGSNRPKPPSLLSRLM